MNGCSLARRSRRGHKRDNTQELAWVQLDTKGKRCWLACEEQAALQSSPMGAFPFCPSPFLLPGLHGCSCLTFASPSKLSGCCAASMVPALSVPRDPLEGQGLPGKGWRGSSATWVGALGDQDGLLAALELTISQACCGWGRQGAPLSPAAAELVLYKTVPGLLCAPACLELWLLRLLGEVSVGSCCPVSPSLGNEEDEGR